MLKSYSPLVSMLSNVFVMVENIFRKKMNLGVIWSDILWEKALVKVQMIYLCKLDSCLMNF